MRARLANLNRDFLVALLLSVGALGAFPQPVVAPSPPTGRDSHWCATSSENAARLRELKSWVGAREKLDAAAGRRTKAEAASRIDRDIVILEATPAMVPLHAPFDLANRSVTYTPGEGGQFVVTNTALAYDEDVGPRLHTFADSGASDWFLRSFDLTAMEFPFGGENRTRLVITAYNSIHFASSPPFTAEQLRTAEALSLEGPLIAPLLQSYQGPLFPLAELFVKETAEAVTVTWRSGPSETGFALDIQARLEASGRVVFSYRTVRQFAWGAVIVTTGSEPWRSEKARIHSQGALVSPINGSVAQMLDLRSVSIDRIGGSSLLEITVTALARIRRETLPAGKSLGYRIELRDAAGGGDWLYLHVTRDAVQYRTPGAGWVSASPAARIAENAIVLRVLEETLNLSEGQVTVDARTFGSDSPNAVDEMSGSFQRVGAATRAGFDLSEAAAGANVNGPVVETFTVGILEPDAVWSALKDTYGFPDDRIDAVAIYQDFFTDLVLYAGAYSTVGNPAADGVALLDGYGTAYPRTPALLHMNKVGFRWNADLPRSYHVLSHEFGHRWLYFIDIDQGSGASSVLQPLGGHPAQYVHTPAAFEVYGAGDSSTMGGARFSDLGGGMFSVPPDWGYYGYSWHELYLMGLADRTEVANWYYVANSSPALGGAYYPTPGITVSGSRRNVSIDDVIRAMGPRVPSVATSQKSFKVVFVLLSEPGREPSEDAIAGLDEQRRWFERQFRIATGHRAEVNTTLVPVRRRGIRQ